MKGPTVKERLAAALNATTLMQLALAADADRAGFDLQEVFDALVPQADMISSELYWIKKALTEAVLDAQAPTDDERIAGQNAEEREGSCAMTAGEIELVRVYRSLDIEEQQLLLTVGSRLLIKLAMPALPACDPAAQAEIERRKGDPQRCWPTRAGG